MVGGGESREGKVKRVSFFADPLALNVAGVCALPNVLASFRGHLL